jgi:spermidine/putrescine transport system substrate-binding protein
MGVTAASMAWDCDRRRDTVRPMLTRRGLLERSAAAAFAAYLAACGEETGGVEREPEQVKAIRKGEIASSMTFSNWPLYIEEDRGTLRDFEREFGTKIRYVEEINENQEFFGKVRPQYSQGDSGGRDLHVVSDYMAARMMRLGYVQRLDHSELPTVERNLIDRLRRPQFDAGREFSVPWQSGMTGLIYRKDKVKREPRSMQDLFDPDYKGKVTLLSEPYDTVPMMLLALGKDPANATVDEMLEAIERCERESASGQVRGFTGNEYTKDITKGDSWLIMGWSGDAIQLQADNPNIRFVQPEEGFLLWSDNMQVPVGAPHAFTAQKFMDFVYRPEVQVDITEWVNYVCPVKGVRELIERRDPELAESELIFPSPETLVNSTDLRPLEPDEEREMEEAFQRVLGA